MAIWSVACVLAGYAAGASYRRVEQWIGRGAIVLAVLVVGGLFVAHRVRAKRSDPTLAG